VLQLSALLCIFNIIQRNLFLFLIYVVTYVVIISYFCCEVAFYVANSQSLY